MRRIARLFDRLEDWSARFDQRLGQHPGWYLFLLSLIYFSITITIASIKQFWFDEFITLYCIRFHSLGQLWDTLRRGVDLNPPIFHLLVRASVALLGEGPITLRIPSMLGYWVMSIALFLFVSRRTNRLYGMVAAIFPCVTAGYEYAFEARPYGVVLACCALMLLSWQAATESRRRLGLVGLALAFALAIGHHYYAVLLVIPVGMGELVRTLHRRKIDWGVWGSLAFGFTPLLAFFPLIRAGMSVHKASYAYVWNKTDVAFLWTSYWELLDIAIVPFLLLLIWLAVFSTSSYPKTERPEPRNKIPSSELAAGLTLCALPIIACLLSLVYVGMITLRYVLPTVVGFGVMMAFGSYLISRARYSVGMLMATALLGWAAVHTGLIARGRMEMREQFSIPDSKYVLRARGYRSLPIVIQDGLLALPMDYYVAQDIRSRMVFPVDLDAVRHYDIVDSPERCMVIGKGTYPIPQVPLEQFRREHSQYLVYGMHAGWLVANLIAEGAKVKVLYWGKWELLFLVNDNHAEIVAKGGQTAGSTPVAALQTAKGPSCAGCLRPAILSGTTSSEAHQ